MRESESRREKEREDNIIVSGVAVETHRERAIRLQKMQKVHKRSIKAKRERGRKEMILDNQR